MHVLFQKADELKLTNGLVRMILPWANREE
jgi:hypothetical protein